MNLDELDGWLGEHGIDRVRVDALSLDGMPVGKVIRASRFAEVAAGGVGITDFLMGIDREDEPALTFTAPTAAVPTTAVVSGSDSDSDSLLSDPATTALLPLKIRNDDFSIFSSTPILTSCKLFKRPAGASESSSDSLSSSCCWSPFSASSSSSSPVRAVMAKFSRFV